MHKLSKPLSSIAPWCVHLFSLLPLLWLVWAIPAGKLGGDPVKELTHFLGMGGLRLLLLSLLITPLAKKVKLPGLTRCRRPLGLWCFTWVSLHFATWIFLDLGLAWRLIAEELIVRTYIAVGFIAWCILFALAVTSVPALLRKLGKRWKPLHRCVYWVAILVCLHFYWSVKSGWLEPAIYACITALLLWPRRAYFYNGYFLVFRRSRKKTNSNGTPSM